MERHAFLFDLDGVLVDTAKYHFLTWQHIASNLGVSLTQKHHEQLKGLNRAATLDYIITLGNIKASAADRIRWLKQKNDEYLSLVATMDPSAILPGAMRVLCFLKQKKQPIALGSSSKNARLVLEKVKLTSFFDVIVDGSMVAAAKPSPEIYIQATQKLQVDPKNAIVFEDSIAGIAAANAIGMLCIGIGDHNVLTGAHHVFPDFTKITDAFLERLFA